MSAPGPARKEKKNQNDSVRCAGAGVVALVAGSLGCLGGVGGGFGWCGVVDAWMGVLVGDYSADSDYSGAKSVCL